MKWFFKGWYSRRQGRSQAFRAGVSAVIIWGAVILVLGSHGQHDNSPVSWWDIIQFLFVMAVFGDSCVELYRYFQQKGNEPDWSIIIRFKSKEERDKYWAEVKGEKK